MITLYTFGPYFGLPDGSPFVIKAMLLLKLAGLAFQENRNGYGKAPKGKLPFIEDDGVRVADSTFIRFHIEEKYGFDFDRSLTERDKAIAWAVEKMCEDHLYWAILNARWSNDANFAKGPAQFFHSIPAPVRPLVARIVRNKMIKSTKAHGLGRHNQSDIERLAIRDLQSLSDILGSKPYLMGDEPCSADASLYGSISGVLVSTFDTPIRAFAETRDNLIAYEKRMSTRYFGGTIVEGKV